ncbi:MAG: hypothetical protein EOP08_15415, partial [Proteobacteria bacterium]
MNAPLDVKRDAATLGQWQLIGINFAKHRLAVWSTYVLVLLYAVALFAEVVAPAAPGRGDLDHQYCPPQLLRWNWEHGLHVRAMDQRVDPISLRRTYVEDANHAIPIRLFARGDAYELWGRSGGGPT